MSVPTRPLSPWAQRFGYRSQARLSLFIDDEIHSSLAARAPTLHPKYYADVPPIEGPPTKASQLDHLFINEKYQRPALLGAETWQFGPLMRYVWFSQRTGLFSGGHLEADSRPLDAGWDEKWEDIVARIFESERIQVDESQWLHFLRKDRWYDMPVMQSQPTIYEPSTEHERWSVDNPEVWRHLRISLELVDRILKALIVDRHYFLETILFGLVVPWSEAYPDTEAPCTGCSCLFSRTYLDGKLAPDVQNPLAFITELTSNQWATRLEKLLANRTWGMMENLFLNKGSHGITLHVLDGMMLVNVGILRNLRSPDTTLSEKCIMYFFLAQVMIHELFHSMYSSRQVKDSSAWSEDYPCTFRLSHPGAEPLFDGDGLAELGHAGISRIWGGDICINNDIPFEIPLGILRTTWPHPAEGNKNYTERRVSPIPIIPDHEQFKLGVTIYMSPMPALNAAKLLSAAFWDEPSIPQKSLDGFYCNAIFNANTPWGGDIVQYPMKLVELNEVLPERLDPGERDMIIAWEERRLDWNSRRMGWYEPLRQEWGLTPWADIAIRNVLILFMRDFYARDEVGCRSLASALLFVGYWGPDRDKFVQRITTRHGWVQYAIGILMYAALPIRTDVLWDQGYEVVYNLYPSRHAKPEFKQITYGLETELFKRNHGGAVRNVLCDPLTRPGTRDRFFTHRSYLELIPILFQFLGENGIDVHTAWYDAIMNMYKSLQAQRPGLDDHRMWVMNWSLVAPDYNTNKSRFIDGHWEDIG